MQIFLFTHFSLVILLNERALRYACGKSLMACPMARLSKVSSENPKWDVAVLRNEAAMVSITRINDIYFYECGREERLRHKCGEAQPQLRG